MFPCMGGGGEIPPSFRATDAQTAMGLFWTRILA